MKKGYFIFFKGNKEFVGVEKKIDNQIRALNVWFDCQKLAIYREKYQLIKSIVWRLPFGSFGMHYEQAWEKIDNPDFFYIRSMLADRRFIKFIKELRLRYPNCKILMEIPTYPYVHEWKSAPSMLPFYIKDMWHHRYLKKYIDRIVTFSDDDKIFDIPTIKTKNGIWLDDVDVTHKSNTDDKIILLAVAQFQPSHGYERVIQGLSNYYNNGGRRIIELHMVGYGGETNNYINLANDLNLRKYVFFHGKKTGKELEPFYEMADIGLSCFGLYKRKINKISAIKASEYLAKGLPVISGCIENAFENNDVDFFYQFSNDSTPIDMEKIISFYDKLYKSGESREEVTNRIRDYANKTIDMRVVMKPVINYLNLL